MAFRLRVRLRKKQHLIELLGSFLVVRRWGFWDGGDRNATRNVRDVLLRKNDLKTSEKLVETEKFLCLEHVLEVVRQWESWFASQKPVKTVFLVHTCLFGRSSR